MYEIKGLSLFANVGIAEAMFDEIGVRILLANEIDERRARFYSEVYPNTEMICGDITDESVRNHIVQKAIEMGVNFIIATPPCGVPETCNKVAHLGRAIYLPLSVKVSEVEQYRCEKTKDTAYVGRKGKRNNIPFPLHTDFVEGLPRDKLLKELAKYRKVYAVGRTAIEAKILGCEILPYDPRFPDPGIWQIVDSSDAKDILQKQLDVLDGV